MSFLITQEIEEGAFSYRIGTYIFGIKIEEFYSNKGAMNEIEFFPNKDFSLTRFCCYKYLESCTKKKSFIKKFWEVLEVLKIHHKLK